MAFREEFERVASFPAAIQARRSEKPLQGTLARLERSLTLQ
jgi:hypothetical protein